ncbi:unnamed protein product [Tuber melanosporum]|uniref:(Perigord truffle) hypothetical protein n=1 Tax=Tuber melanosporum (strain Mel28) TaxID=656061 RepID=D5G4I8_TUBMM|nr:uncharacterized protein GSTUM_00004131001 [Tuber melanosporum]CAZ79431.1 unnamed protein product [Tuber melanosporum]
MVFFAGNIAMANQRIELKPWHIRLESSISNRPGGFDSGIIPTIAWHMVMFLPNPLPLRGKESPEEGYSTPSLSRPTPAKCPISPFRFFCDPLSYRKDPVRDYRVSRFPRDLSSLET